MAPALSSLFVLAASVSGAGAVVVYDGSFGTFAEGAFGPLPADAPAWCKAEADLTWKQRKERLLQHDTLEWCKVQVRHLQAANESVPEWMDKLVEDDRKRGQMKWAAAETKRLRAEGKEVPQWMDWAAAENEKWGNRWAACKAAELQAAGEEPPAWMVENGRKGVLDYASEKQKDLQEQIDELQEEREEEEAVIQADGNATMAEERRLAMQRAVYKKSAHQQLDVLQAELASVQESEEAWEKDTSASPKQLKRALKKAQQASVMMEKILARMKEAKAKEEAEQQSASGAEPVVDVTAE